MIKKPLILSPEYRHSLRKANGDVKEEGTLVRLYIAVL